MKSSAAIAIGRWPFDEPFPAVLHDVDLMRALGISPASFYVRKARREFARFELESDAPRARTEYSGALVAQWLQTGDLPRRFFKGSTRPQVVRTGKAGRPRKLHSLA